MTLGKLALFVSLDIIIVTLAVKTKVYAAIIKMISRIVPCIMTTVILFSLLFLFVLLVIICNGICTEYTDVVVSQTTNKYNILNDLREFGLNCIRYSPQVFLFFSFANQALFCVGNKKGEGRNISKIQASLSRMKMSIAANNVTVLCVLAFVVFDGLGIFNARFVNYVRDYNFFNIDIYSEDTIRVGLIVLLGIFYYVSICLMSNNFVCQVVAYYNRTCNAGLKAWKYKLMTYFPFLNMCVACSLNEELNIKKAETTC